LKEEIQRVLELEAENAVLQESLATLPQLRKDRMAFLKLQEHFQKECVCGVKKNLSDREDGEEGDDEGDDTEEEISIVPTEVTNEVLPNILHKSKRAKPQVFLAIYSAHLQMGFPKCFISKTCESLTASLQLG
jgi:hypothetical protein